MSDPELLSLNIKLSPFDAGVLIGSLYRAADSYAEGDPLRDKIRSIANRVAEVAYQIPEVDTSRIQLINMNEIGVQPQMEVSDDLPRL